VLARGMAPPHTTPCTVHLTSASLCGTKKTSQSPATYATPASTVCPVLTSRRNYHSSRPLVPSASVAKQVRYNTPDRHLWPDSMDNVGSSTSHNLLGLHGLLRGELYFFSVLCPLCPLLFVQLCVLLCLGVVCYFVWYVYIILVPLPPGKHPFAVQ
jgi:hypothetical protein